MKQTNQVEFTLPRSARQAATLLDEVTKAKPGQVYTIGCTLYYDPDLALYEGEPVALDKQYRPHLLFAFANHEDAVRAANMVAEVLGLEPDPTWEKPPIVVSEEYVFYFLDTAPAEKQSEMGLLG